MRKRGSNKEAQVDAMINALAAWKFKNQGLSYPEIAARMDVSLKTVRRHIDRILPAASTFATELTPEEINKARQSESEILYSARGKVIRRMSAVEEDPKTSEADKLFAMAAGLRALSVANKRLAAMNALDAPVKIVEEQHRLSLSVVKTDNRVQIVWDPSILKGD